MRSLYIWTATLLSVRARPRPAAACRAGADATGLPACCATQRLLGQRPRPQVLTPYCIGQQGCVPVISLTRQGVHGPLHARLAACVALRQHAAHDRAHTRSCG